MNKKTATYKIITSEDQDAPFTTDSNLPQFLQACHPEIDAQAFNRKFVSIPNECLSSLKELRVITQEKIQKIKKPTAVRNPNNSSSDYYTSDYHGDSSSYCSYTSNGHYQTTSPKNNRLQSVYDDDYLQFKKITFSFLPVVEKGPNYLKYCTGWLSDDEKPSNVTDCVRQYTSGSNWYCTEVNFALASDSSTLKIYSSYIKQLKYCIGISRGYVGTVYRGKFCNVLV